MTAKHAQFQVYHANLKDQLTKTTEGVQIGIRPVIIISNDEFIKRSPVVNVLPLTTQSKESPVHLAVWMDCKERKSYILFEQIMTISKYCLQSFDGIFDTDYVDMIWDRLDFQFGRERDINHRTRLFSTQTVIPHILSTKYVFI